jgi:hypothetical protein
MQPEEARGPDVCSEEDRWTDYNALPLPASRLPKVSPWALCALGLALLLLLTTLFLRSLRLAADGPRRPAPAARGH